jgi:hypothetical protein
VSAPNPATHAPPRPAALRHIRKLTYQASLDYITDNSSRLESRTAIAALTSDFNNADQLTASYSRSYEQLDAPFAIDRRATIPVGAYPFETTTIAYTLGPTRRARGTLTGNAGSSYAGTRRGVEYSGRLGVTGTIAVEPTISRDLVAFPGTRSTPTSFPRASSTTGRRKHRWRR